MSCTLIFYGLGLVGAGGLEPPASASRTLRANRLRYAPPGAAIIPQRVPFYKGWWLTSVHNFCQGKNKEGESLSGGFCGGEAAAKTPYQAFFPLPASRSGEGTKWEVGQDP